MCNCISEIKDLYKEKNPQIRAIYFPAQDLVTHGNKLYVALSVRVEFEIEGRKSRLKNSIFPQFCPFCGKKHIEGGDNE